VYQIISDYQTVMVMPRFSIGGPLTCTYMRHNFTAVRKL